MRYFDYFYSDLDIILSFDPGDSTGFAIGCFSDGGAYEVLDSGVIPGGVTGFIAWLCHGHAGREIKQILSAGLRCHVVSEKFVVEPSFVGDCEALKIEGVITARFGLDANPCAKTIVYQLRSEKAALIGGSDGRATCTEAERFRWLKANGLVNPAGLSGEAHDLDAITHALLFLKKRYHAPTLKKFWLKD